MNPFDFLDCIESKKDNEILNGEKEEYTKEEVSKLLKEMSLEFRKAIYNGEHIFNLETVDSRTVTIADDEYSIKTLITEDNKYLLFVQVLDINEDYTDSDSQILAEEIQKAVSTSTNIAGVIVLPPNLEISLITAKLNTLTYANSLNFTEQDLEEFKKFNSIKNIKDKYNNSYNIYNPYYDYVYDITSSTTGTTGIYKLTKRTDDEIL